MTTQKTIRKRDYIFMQDPYGGGGNGGLYSSGEENINGRSFNET